MFALFMDGFLSQCSIKDQTICVYIYVHGASVCCTTNRKCRNVWNDAASLVCGNIVCCCISTSALKQHLLTKRNCQCVTNQHPCNCVYHNGTSCKLKSLAAELQTPNHGGARRRRHK